MANLLPEMAEIWQQTLDWQPNYQQQQKFQRLYHLIIEGNRQLNLTRITDAQEFWEKHLWDSLRGIAPSGKLLPCTLETKSIIDIGTGAGFPGVPISIVFGNYSVNLLDSTRKKITFVDKILNEISLTNSKTIIGRAEEIGHNVKHRRVYDIALIRAVGNASVCAEYTIPLLKQGGLAIIYRGNWTDEETQSLASAAQELGAVIELIDQFTTPLTHSTRHCLYLRKIASTPANYPRGVGVPSVKPL